jgi:CRP/FNR family transcriptional regulator
MLRMTRNEIGSYLGLKLETISRAMSHFQSEGIITVQNKNVEIKDTDRLRAMVGQCAGNQ